MKKFCTSSREHATNIINNNNNNNNNKKECYH